MKTKIFFIHSRDIERNDSGGARTLIMQIEYLSTHGFECHCLFRIINGPTDDVVYYENGDNVLQQAKKIIIENNIKLVMIPEAKIYGEVLSKELKGLNVSIITALHNKPGYDRCRLYVLLWESAKFNEKWIKRARALMLLIIYPLFYSLHCYIDFKKFRNAYKNSDYLVLLAESFIPEFSNIYNVDGKKLRAIGNPISFDSYANMEDVEKKENSILIVSRFEERSKRLLMSLKIWELIQYDYPDWNLEIVGFGRSKPIYDNYVKRHKLQRVYFRGKQTPIEYYRKSSIFMMTSAYEGWGMTIVEAMQMGCVPIVMDSYSSLHSLIDNEENGYIIDNSDVTQFSERISYLINNTSLRKEMSMAAIKKSHEWEPENIFSKYVKLYRSIIENNEETCNTI